jgi:hypothetical protein
MTLQQNPQRSNISWAKYPLTASCILTAGVLTVWLVPHWDYLPEWAPVPGLALNLQCLYSFILCLLAWPLFVTFTARLAGRLVLSLSRIRSKLLIAVIILAICLGILSLAATPLLLEDKADGLLVKFAIARYNFAIDAIERYHRDHGEYPPSLNALVPCYLPTTPGIYMKYSETLRYDPDSQKGYAGHGPFTFELYGHYWILHGHTLKYCPIGDSTCRGFGRIDDRWVVAFASAF